MCSGRHPRSVARGDVATSGDAARESLASSTQPNGSSRRARGRPWRCGAHPPTHAVPDIRATGPDSGKQWGRVFYLCDSYPHGFPGRVAARAGVFTGDGGICGSSSATGKNPHWRQKKHQPCFPDETARPCRAVSIRDRVGTSADTPVPGDAAWETSLQCSSAEDGDDTGERQDGPEVMVLETAPTRSRISGPRARIPGNRSLVFLPSIPIDAAAGRGRAGSGRSGIHSEQSTP